ncbi:UPF0481 protein At3g47200-like isoform X2 [Papaver somniferum]|uniref:UPF0481 protein At3g47200-like isoform X2 n=1 Tax=Papaver somniferum TaxID=3469 RepID=UPI000E704DC8|nr:UPF0481 protein At3g47200-like isoform X2 [Papaver somniferum]
MARGGKSLTLMKTKRYTQEDTRPAPQWVIDIKQEETDQLDFGKSWTIYRVPTNLFEVQKSAFIPKIISMMVMDACFVIELLRLYHNVSSSNDIEEEERAVADPIFTTRWMLRALQRDLMMIQNQLPFFVLQELYRLIILNPRKGGLEDNISLIDLTLKFFDPLLPKDENENVDLDPDPEEYRHLLHLFRKSFISPIKRKKPLMPRTGSTATKHTIHPQLRTESTRLKQESHFIQCVTELKEAGITLLEKPEKSNIDIFDVEYEKGVLKIPTLFIDDNTVPLFLNFIAYEQCDKDATPYFTNHFMFFDRLVDSIKDVEALHRTGIIRHIFGSEKKVAYLINRLCREIVYNVDNCHLSEQMTGINEYYKAYHANKWYIWWTRLVRDYFSSPWTVLSLLAACLLMAFTAGQTFYALYGYYKPRN